MFFAFNCIFFKLLFDKHYTFLILFKFNLTLLNYNVVALLIKNYTKLFKLFIIVARLIQKLFFIKVFVTINKILINEKKLSKLNKNNLKLIC